MGVEELKLIHFLMHCKTTHSPSERLPPQVTPATSIIAEEVRLVGAARSRQEKVNPCLCLFTMKRKQIFLNIITTRAGACAS